MEESKYCVYSHIDDNNVTFYIGIGDSKRPYDSRQRSKFWKSYVKKHCSSGKPKIEIIHEGVSWEEACGHEQFWILFWGRRDNGTGVLVNMTDGGEGAVGAIRSEEHKRKIGEAGKGRYHSEESRLKMSEARKGHPSHRKCKTLSEEHRKKLSEVSKGKTSTFKGKHHSEEAKQKLRESRMGKPVPTYKGRKHTEEAKQKQSNALHGKGKGYTFIKGLNKWRACIRIGNNKRHYLGYFLTEAEASNAYRTALSSLKGAPLKV